MPIFKDADDFLYEVARGRIQNLQLFDKFYYNSAVGNTEEDVWTTGGTLTHQTSTQTLEIVSASGNDTSGGTGARTVKIFGLDGNYESQNETLTMNGATAVDTVNKYLRIHRLAVITAGTGGKNAGVITLRVDGGGDTQGEIVAGDNQSLMSQFTIPANKTAFLTKYSIGVGKAQDATVRFCARVVDEVFQVKKIHVLFEAYLPPTVEHEIMFEEKTDIVVRAVTSAGTVAVSGNYGLLLVNGTLTGNGIFM